MSLAVILEKRHSALLTTSLQVIHGSVCSITNHSSLMTWLRWWLPEFFTVELLIFPLSLISILWRITLRLLFLITKHRLMVFILFNIHNVTIILYLNCLPHPPPAHSLASVKLFKLSFFPFDVCKLFFRPFLSGANRCPRTILLFSLPSLEIRHILEEGI